MKPLTAATGMTNTMLGSTLSNDPLSDKRFDFQFLNPPYGYDWSKDYDADTFCRDPSIPFQSPTHFLKAT